MKKGDDLQPNQSARVLRGAFAGAVGEVISVDRDGGNAVVRINGTWGGVPTDINVPFKLARLGRPT